MSGASGCKGVAVIDQELCKQYMCTGPVIRGAGVPYDIRKVYPYLDMKIINLMFRLSAKAMPMHAIWCAWKR